MPRDPDGIGKLFPVFGLHILQRMLLIVIINGFNNKNRIAFSQTQIFRYSGIGLAQ